MSVSLAASPSATGDVAGSRGADTAALAAAVLGFFVITLDTTVVNVALPAIRDDFGGGMTGLQWVLDSYTLMFAALLLSAGAVSDRIGAHRAFGTGMAMGEFREQCRYVVAADRGAGQAGGGVDRCVASGQEASDGEEFVRASRDGLSTGVPRCQAQTPLGPQGGRQQSDPGVLVARGVGGIDGGSVAQPGSAHRAGPRSTGRRPSRTAASEPRVPRPRGGHR
ncbi:hypothetical protein ACH4TX_37850 [Streptomyces sp. NPDC021098]|uniref:hypothetical protein n=1 Tax=unclassified Streptomyces TaxID=2593676 RepID=UPI0037A97958